MVGGEARSWRSAESASGDVEALLHHEVADEVELDVREILWSGATPSVFSFGARQTFLPPHLLLLFLFRQLLFSLSEHLAEK